jgi:hypothetical protein
MCLISVPDRNYSSGFDKIDKVSLYPYKECFVGILITKILKVKLMQMVFPPVQFGYLSHSFCLCFVMSESECLS